MHRDISDNQKLESKLTSASLSAPFSTLLFGATSILGFSLARMFSQSILPFVTPGCRAPSLLRWPALKLEDGSWPRELFQRRQPNALLYCHAVCDVPKCEAAPEWAREINVEHVRRVLAALPEKTRLIYVSSDHVFGGDGVYDEDAAPCPVSVYGKTRVQAEELVLNRNNSLIVRIGLPIVRRPTAEPATWIGCAIESSAACRSPLSTTSIARWFGPETLPRASCNWRRAPRPVFATSRRLALRPGWSWLIICCRNAD